MESISRLLGFEARYIVHPVLAIAGATVIRLVIHHYLKAWAKRTESSVDDKIVSYLDNTVLPLLLLAILYLFSRWLPVSQTAVFWIQRSVLVLSAALVALFLAKLSNLLIENLAAQQESRQKFVQPLRTLVNVVFLLLAIALSLRILAVNLTADGLVLIRIVGIVVGAFLVLRILNLAVMHLERLAASRDAAVPSEAERRAKTIGNIINSLGLVLVLGVAFMMILSEFGMDITPIITGAGIAGLAVGFGAQNLVRDVISGFFLILEDQLRVGDVAVLNSTSGHVEAINLRTTVLRDLQGVVHIFPNGEIKQVSNMTKGFSNYVIDVGIAYKENVDYVMDVLKDIGEELARDPDYAEMILAPLEIMGVDDFADSQVTIKVRIRTLPLKQWAVGRELRRRIKNTFDKKGIEIPFPHVSVYFGEASKPIDVALRNQSRDQELPVR